ncbi:hypothetical protein [Lamprocystis purpurea]|uniref:hypothetical protein n=1 Tax=Lamprocystis purpurea TaxID=61598 RepID=UPI0003680E43|nr:hypothetical protein [Lamprocystis purpurea]
MAIEAFQALDGLGRPSDGATRNPIAIGLLIPNLNRLSDYDYDNDNDNDRDAKFAFTWN